MPPRFDETGRELSFELPPVDRAFYSISEGIIIRRNESGDVAIADDDGAVWRLYKPTRANPAIMRPGLPQRRIRQRVADGMGRARQADRSSRRAASDRCHPAL